MLTETRELPAERTPQHAAVRWVIVACIVASLLAGGVQSVQAFVNRNVPQDVSLATSVTAAELASEYGIELTLVGITAAGGLVDVRFRIDDADKALRIFNDPDVMPAVYVEETGEFLAPRHGMRHHQIDPVEVGTYFMHLANEGGAVEEGTIVTVVFNTVKIEGVEAQS